MTRFKVIYHYFEESEIEISIELNAENMIQAEETALRILNDRIPKSRLSWIETELIREVEESENVPDPVKTSGDYYLFDCMDADLADRYIPIGEFNGDNHAIRTAQIYEATLYKVHFENDQQIGESVILYDPFY